MTRLTRDFFGRPATLVAQALLGQRLVRRFPDGAIAAGLIVETEAYCDGTEPDLACHGARNRGRPTARTAVMFGPPGHAYVYFTYGMHWLFNIVTGSADQANAVLVRALEPCAGESRMARNRPGRPRTEWTNGPAKLTQALEIDGRQHGLDLCDPDGPLWLEAAPPPPPSAVRSGPRIGLGNTPEPWRSIPWRYWIADNPFVSRP